MNYLNTVNSGRDVFLCVVGFLFVMDAILYFFHSFRPSSVRTSPTKKDTLIRFLGSHFFILYAAYVFVFQRKQLESYAGALQWDMIEAVANRACVILMFLLMGISYLLRRPARVRAVGFWERFFPFFCAVLPIVMNESSRFLGRSSVLEWSFAFELSTVFLFLGNAISIWGLVALRSSFSIMSEVREFVHRGPYRFIRHPLYSAQILSTTALWLKQPNWPGAFLLVVFIVGQAIRGVREERKIEAVYPEYARYRQKTGAYVPRAIVRGLQCFLGVVFLAATILVFNGIQMLSLLVRPFSSKAFRKVNSWAASTWWGLCVVLCEWFYGTQVVVSGDGIPCDENAMIILNHQSMADIPVVLALAHRKKRLGDLKWYVKDVIKYVPGIGWGMLFIDCLFIKRNWAEDRDHVVRIFERILKHRIPVWIVSFVEGTRMTPSKLAQSQEYARRQGFFVPRHVLVPRTKGAVATIQALRRHLHSVYDLTIVYEKPVPTIWNWICGEVKSVHLHVRRHPVSSLPEEESALSSWMVDVFRQKDEYLEKNSR